MTKSKRSFATKLFLAVLATNVAIITVIAILVGQNMRSGFSRYLLEVELQRFDDLATLIAETHRSYSNWDYLRKSPKNWHDLVRRSIGELTGRPPRSSDARSTGSELRRFQKKPDHPLSPHVLRPVPPPPHSEIGLRRFPDPLRLGERLSLVDKNGSQVAGGSLKGGLSARRAIFTLDPKAEGHALEQEDETLIGYLVLSAPEGNVGLRDSDFLFDQFRNLLLASLLALILSALAAFFLARGVLHPINSLIIGTARLAKGNYDARMKEDRNDEFGQLIVHFNALASSLEDAEKAERQWLSDASHELKTPLAILRGRIEGIQDGIYQPDKSLITEMHQTVERLTVLVSDLNLLAHAREGQLLIHSCEENLSELIQDALDHAASRLQEKGLVCEADVPEMILVECDRIRIRQLLDNLIENSRRYSRGPGIVRISAEPSSTTDPYTYLVIEDSAPCPPEDSLSRLFERFFRTDPSRDRRSGGSGLGLAICRAIVQAHGGAIEAAPSALGGLKVKISFPTGQDQLHILTEPKSKDA